MKKLFAILLAMMMVLSLVACGAEEESNADLVITRAPVEETEEPVAQEAAVEDAPEEEPVQSSAVVVESYAFEAEGVALVPGAAFDVDALPEASSVYTVPSCALEGTDNVYNYDDAYEVTAFNEGDGEFIYSIYLLDPNVTTAEGLALGDTKDKVVQLYGDGYQDNGNEYVYQAGETLLSIIFQGDTVLSIEYRLDV